MAKKQILKVELVGADICMERVRLVPLKEMNGHGAFVHLEQVGGEWKLLHCNGTLFTDTLPDRVTIEIDRTGDERIFRVKETGNELKIDIATFISELGVTCPLIHLDQIPFRGWRLTWSKDLLEDFTAVESIVITKEM